MNSPTLPNLWLLLCLSCSIVLVQGLEWGRLPNEAVSPQVYWLDYSTNSSSQVTITLQRGDLESLTLADVLFVGSPYKLPSPTFAWSVAEDLVTGDDYVLKIAQDDETDYSGQFWVKTDTVASGASSISTPSETSSASAAEIPRPTGTVSLSTPASSGQPSTSPSTGPSTPASASSRNASNGGLGAGAIAGIVIGAIAALVFIVIAILLLRRWRPSESASQTAGASPDRPEEELSAGHKANRHEIFGKPKQVGERVEKDGREVRIRDGGLHELPDEKG